MPTIKFSREEFKVVRYIIMNDVRYKDNISMFLRVVDRNGNRGGSISFPNTEETPVIISVLAGVYYWSSVNDVCFRIVNKFYKAYNAHWGLRQRYEVEVSRGKRVCHRTFKSVKKYLDVEIERD